MSENKESKEEKKVIVVKNATDLQRLKLEKLMKNPVSFIKVDNFHTLFKSQCL